MVIRRCNPTVFSFEFTASTKYGNQVSMVNQWERLTGLVGMWAVFLCVVPMVQWWRPQCLGAPWPDLLECHLSWQKCRGTTATATAAAMRISVYAIDCRDLYRLHLVLVHSRYQKMARQGLLVGGCTADWQGKGVGGLSRSYNCGVPKLFLRPRTTNCLAFFFGWPPEMKYFKKFEWNEWSVVSSSSSFKFKIANVSYLCWHERSWFWRWRQIIWIFSWTTSLGSLGILKTVELCAFVNNTLPLHIVSMNTLPRPYCKTWN